MAPNKKINIITNDKQMSLIYITFHINCKGLVREFFKVNAYGYSERTELYEFGKELYQANCVSIQ